MLLLEGTKRVEIDPIEELSWPSESDGFSPSVHSIETSGQKLSSWLENAGKSRWNPGLLNDSALVYGIMDEDKPVSRADQIRTCRSGHWFVRHEDTGLVRLATNSCGLRWCPKCSDARANSLAHNVGEWCKTFDDPKFLTLTLKHTSAPLDFQLKQLYKFFRQLRKHKEFRKYVWGGVWGLHIKKSDTDDLWHPHLHCLIHAAFYPHKQLSRIWQKITHSSTVVDIRPVHDSVGAAYDIAGYAACPYDLSKHSLDDNVTVYHALHGKRICGAWGTAKGIPLRPGKLLDKQKWHNVGSLSVVQAFYNQDPSAQAIADAWHDNVPLEEGIDICRLDAFRDDGPGQSWNEAWPSNGNTSSRGPPREDPTLW